MKTSVIKNQIILYVVIIILLTNISIASAQPEPGKNKLYLFNIQFVMNIVNPGNETETPFHPGEIREVNLTITYGIVHGIFGEMILQLLKGKTFPIRLSIENKSDYCEAWIIPENITGIIQPDNKQMDVIHLFIHLNEDAPNNYTFSWVTIHGTIEDKKGPFNILTLIHGFEQSYTLPFFPGP